MGFRASDEDGGPGSTADRDDRGDSGTTLTVSMVNLGTDHAGMLAILRCGSSPRGRRGGPELKAARRKGATFSLFQSPSTCVGLRDAFPRNLESASRAARGGTDPGLSSNEFNDMLPRDARPPVGRTVAAAAVADELPVEDDDGEEEEEDACVALLRRALDRAARLGNG